MSEGLNWTMRCVNGHELEGETPDTRVEDRRPCPECGTTARAISMSVTAAIGTVASPSPPAPSPPPSSLGDLADRVAAFYTDITVRCYEPSGPGGSWIIQAFDSDSETIAMAEHLEWEEAALSILEQLNPRRREIT